MNKTQAKECCFCLTYRLDNKQCRTQHELPVLLVFARTVRHVWLAVDGACQTHYKERQLGASMGIKYVVVTGIPRGQASRGLAAKRAHAG